MPETRTVPHLLPESPDFAAMPEALAVVEWACIEALHGHLDDGELTLGTHVDLSHDAPTVPGSKMSVVVRLVEVDGLSLVFEVEACDNHAVISSGVHRRSIIDGDRFENRIA